jgi:hypothetical protein
VGDPLKKTLISIFAAGIVLSLRGEAGAPVRVVSPVTGRPQSVSRIEVRPFVQNVERGGKLQLRAFGWSPSGERVNVTQDVEWEVSPPSRGQVDELDRLVGGEPGRGTVVARLGGLRSAPLAVEVLAKGQPDWDVTYIERMPSGDRDGRLGWCAHVKNYGTADAPPVAVEWRVDGKRVVGGTLPSVARFRQTELVLTSPGDGKPHELELVVDGGSEVPEISEENNRLRVSSEAKTVGFWVEESTLRYFHRHQRELGVGSNSWEDWAQRQIAYWNRAERDGKEGRDRWRLDRIVVVGDGVLPLAGGSAVHTPDRRARSLDLTRGFPAYDPGRSPLYRRTADRSMDNPFYFERTLMDGVLTAIR